MFRDDTHDRLSQLELDNNALKKVNTNHGTDLHLLERQFKALLNHLKLKPYSDEYGEWIFMPVEDK